MRGRELEEDDEDEDDERLSDGRLRLAAGILAHWALTARTVVTRRLARRAAQAA